MIGCDDMVLPRINRLSYQVFLVSTLVILLSLFMPGPVSGGLDRVSAAVGQQPVQSHALRGAAVLLGRGAEFVAFLLAASTSSPR